MANRFGDQEITQKAPAQGTNRFGDAGAGTPNVSPNPSMNAKIGPQPEPDGIGGHVSRWAQNVMDDIRYGTDLTGVGSVLKKLGAHGVYNGAPEKVGEYMASLPLGLLRVTKGGGEIAQSGKELEGLKDVGAGAMQALEIPLAFAGGPEVEMGGHAAVASKALQAGVKTAGEVKDAAAKIIPNAERAGKTFQSVMSSTADIPINANIPGDTALRIQDMANRGGMMPKVVKDFLKRVTDPDMGPVTYKEARDFYSNATRRLSPEEKMRMAPTMRRELANFTENLGKSIEEATSQTGNLDQYRQAMEEYHRAMRLRAVGQTLKEAATSSAGKAVGTALGGGLAGYTASRLLR